MGVAVGNLIEPFVNKEFHMHKKSSEVSIKPELVEGTTNYDQTKVTSSLIFIQRPGN